MQLLPVLHKESWTVVVTTLALVLYGVLQERVMTKGWGQNQELFPYSSFLVLSNRLVTVLVLLIHSVVAKHSFVPVAPLRSYCLVSASNMVSTLCQYEALKYVSFVAQTLAKTAKALPVVLWGTIVGGKRYSARQYAHAILITGGCSMFVLGGDVTSSSAASGRNLHNYAMGGVLLLAYLAADGWTSTQQETLFKTHATPIREQLLYTTAFSTAYSLAATVAGGQLLRAVSFLQRHPDAAAAVLSLSLASTVIQVCISTVLQRHGALMFALMMTSRQCVSVLLSTLLFGHRLSVSQWVGIAVAFSALYHQKSSSHSKDKHGHRSRLTAATQASRLPQSRASACGGAQQNLDTSVMQPIKALLGVGPTQVAYRGSGGGFTSQVGLRTATVGGGAISITSPLMVSVGGTSAASAAAPPSSLPVPVPLGSGLQHVGAVSDPHCIAVADVQPVSIVLSSVHQNNGMMHRTGHHPQQQQQQLLEPTTQHQAQPAVQQQQQQHQLSGVPSSKPAAVAEAPSPNAVSPAALQHSAYPSPHGLVPLMPPMPAKKQAFSLNDLWSRGTGRPMVDPTTAVAIEHREK